MDNISDLNNEAGLDDDCGIDAERVIIRTPDCIYDYNAPIQYEFPLLDRDVALKGPTTTFEVDKAKLASFSKVMASMFDADATAKEFKIYSVASREMALIKRYVESNAPHFDAPPEDVEYVPYHDKTLKEIVGDWDYEFIMSITDPKTFYRELAELTQAAIYLDMHVLASLGGLQHAFEEHEKTIEETNIMYGRPENYRPPDWEKLTEYSLWTYDPRFWQTRKIDVKEYERKRDEAATK
jgi:hypothetical protein